MFGESGFRDLQDELDAIGLPPVKSVLALDHCFFDVGYGFAGIQALRAGPRAIEDRMAAIKSEGIFELAEALLIGFIPAVG